MEKPKEIPEPQLSDFCLGHQPSKFLKILSKIFNPMLIGENEPGAYYLVPLFFVVGSGYGLYQIANNIPAFKFLDSLLFFPAAFLFAVLVIFLFSSVVNFLGGTISTKYKNYVRFLKAFERYKEEKKKYDKELGEYEQYLYEKTSEYWYSLDGWTFEKKFAEILNALGIRAEVTSGSSDGGVDIIAYSGRTKTVIQCKAHKKPIGPAVVRDLYGAMHDFGADEALLVALAGGTKGVYEFIKDKPIKVCDISGVIDLKAKADARA